MAETKVCAVCGLAEDAPIFEGGGNEGSSSRHALKCLNENGGDVTQCFFGLKGEGSIADGHHPFIEAHCADCGQTYAELEGYTLTHCADCGQTYAELEGYTLTPCRDLTAHRHSRLGRDVRFFLAIEDRIKAALAPEALADSPVCVHQAQAIDFLRRWTDPADGTTTDDLLEALIAKVDQLSAILTEVLKARYYLAPPDKPVPATGGNPYGPWQPWYPQTVKPFGWPEPVTVSSSTPRT